MQPLTVAVSKINTEIGEKGCFLKDQFWPNADTAARLERM